MRLTFKEIDHLLTSERISPAERITLPFIMIALQEEPRTDFEDWARNQVTIPNHQIRPLWLEYSNARTWEEFQKEVAFQIRWNPTPSRYQTLQLYQNLPAIRLYHGITFQAFCERYPWSRTVGYADVSPGYLWTVFPEFGKETNV